MTFRSKSPLAKFAKLAVKENKKNIKEAKRQKNLHAAEIRGITREFIGKMLELDNDRRSLGTIVRNLPVHEITAQAVAVYTQNVDHLKQVYTSDQSALGASNVQEMLEAVNRWSRFPPKKTGMQRVINIATATIYGLISNRRLKKDAANANKIFDSFVKNGDAVYQAKCVLEAGENHEANIQKISSELIGSGSAHIPATKEPKSVGSMQVFAFTVFTGEGNDATIYGACVANNKIYVSELVKQ